MTLRNIPAAAAFLAIVLTTPAPVQAQIGGAVKRAVKQQTDRIIAEKVRCAFDDPKCIEKAKQDGTEVEIVDADGKVITEAEAAAQAADAEGNAADELGEGIWRNYDFVPGTDVWFALDLSNERIGRFPASQLEFGSGNGQVVELDGEAVLEFSANTTFYVNLPDQLPEDYSIEFALRTGAPNIATLVFVDPVTKESIPYQRYENQYLRLYRRGGIFFQGNAVSTTDSQWDIDDEFTPIKFQVDGNYAILYMGDERV